jgi:hypothetical protein
LGLARCESRFESARTRSIAHEPQRPLESDHLARERVRIGGRYAARDCPRRTCIVAEIAKFERELADRNAEPESRLEALKFLVHFLGDLHQPLHVADDHDRGGNQIWVRFMGRATNLHAVWDTGILAPVVIQGDERSYALRLSKTISDRDRAQWQHGTVVDWVNDSHAIARQIIYGTLLARAWCTAGQLRTRGAAGG